jgi:hypothetical protein
MARVLTHSQLQPQVIDDESKVEKEAGSPPQTKAPQDSCQIVSLPFFCSAYRQLLTLLLASKQLTTTRSRSLLPLELYHHDNVTSKFAPSPASTPTPFSAFQITRTVWDYHSVQWQLSVQGWNSLMTRILWHLMNRLQGSRTGHTHCRIVY